MNTPSQPEQTPNGDFQATQAPQEKISVLGDDDPWPLQVGRAAIQSPLIECLRILAGHYGRRTSPASLTAGLPIPPKGITPDLFMRAAERADMNAKLVERTIDALAIAPILPCLLVLDHAHAVILWDIRFPKKHPPKKEPGQPVEIHPETTFVVQFPEIEDERKIVSLNRLKAMYSGYAFYIRPVVRTDDRAGPAVIDTTRDWFWGTLKEHSRIYKEVSVAAIMINLFALASPLFTMNVYDRVIPNSAFSTLWVLSAGVLTVYIFDFILKNLRAHFLDYAGRKADIKMSASLFEQLLGMTMAARPASAGVMASHMREFEGLRDFFTSATLTALIDLPFALIFVLIIAVIAGPVAIVPFAAMPIVVFVGLALQRPLQKVIKESMNESALKNAHLFETITGLETIKVQAAEGHTQRRWEELNEKSSRTSMKARYISAFASNFAMFIQQIAGVFVVIVGVYLIADGKMTQGALIAAVMLSSRALAPLGQVAGLLTRLSQSREALEQLEDLMKRPVERPADKHFISQSSIRGQIDFRDVVFHYPGQAVPALNHASFTIEPGEHIAIIGAVGSGKTTIERLLLNLYQPDSGSVMIDGTDVRQVDPGDLRRSIGAVQQSPQLFYGSVRENITMGHETASDRAVLRAAELAGVMEHLRDSQAGLDTPVGERGESLSGGQRQAVAIARALLFDPPVMILDEPTSSLDPSSEIRLLKRLTQICKNKTTIVITHKGQMLSLVDKIMLIDRGRVLDFGPKDDIVKKLQARAYGPATGAEE